MTCDCKSQAEASLLERFKEQEPQASDHSAYLQGYPLFFGGRVKQKGAMDAKLTARFPTKTGGTKEKGRTVVVVFTYCPFCGKEYEPKAEEAGQ
jgi:hypothetical protein